MFCRRDDYMFLPPNALAGLPCLDVPAHSSFDPYALAARMAAQLPPPDLRIRMNPEKGMVAVPTWFWVEGYDGGTLSQTETVLQEREICHEVAVRDADGLATLDGAGRPVTRQECHTDSTTFTVSVRLWPSQFAWDFGDGHAENVSCSGRGDCAQALGLPYLDANHPSPIQHPYVWSSLGKNGAQDAYTIQLGITLGAEYLVSVDGQTSGGWRGLPSRTLTWNTPHQVQEAQAVLTRPCPVTVLGCN
jgi:hypothetical protein